MIRYNHLAHSLVDSIPEQLAPGVLYVSSRYSTAVHLCCCGCGSEIVTPLSPAQWRVTFDGNAISLYPSVGNWNLPCRSHYIIKNGQVFEAEVWSEKQVAYGQVRDKLARAAYYEGQILQTPTKQGWWARLWRYLTSKH